MDVNRTPHRAVRRSPAGVRLASICLLVTVLGTGCATTRTDPDATGPAALPVPATPLRADAAGVVEAAGWPDACALGAGRPGEDDAQRTPEPGTLPDGTPVPGARTCTWKLPQGGSVTLRVVIVTEDVLEAWAGYKYSAGLHRDVEGLADEAFLRGSGDALALWVCKGRTIFTVGGRDLPSASAQDRLIDVALAGTATLDGSYVGTLPS